MRPAARVDPAGFGRTWSDLAGLGGPRVDPDGGAGSGVPERSGAGSGPVTRASSGEAGRVRTLEPAARSERRRLRRTQIRAAASAVRRTAARPLPRLVRGALRRRCEWRSAQPPRLHSQPMAAEPNLPPHLERPHVRQFQPLPLQKDGQTFAGLRDPSLIGPQMLIVHPTLLQVVARFRGQETLADIGKGLGIEQENLLELVRRMDEVGLLWGPTFERLEAQAMQRIRDAGAFPPTVSVSVGNDRTSCETRLEGLLSEAEDPELGAPLLGIVAPHLDLDRGGPVYAAAYVAARGLKPDRVVILGTNHFGTGDGVVMSQLGFDTPMGRVRPDSPVIADLERRLGDRLFKDELDHLGEHSLQLHLPWVQHLFGDVPVVAALVPDPNIPMIAEDGARVAPREFAAALGESLGAAGGSTFFVGSSDLSHVGPQFGDAKPVDEARQDDVERHDREYLSVFCQGSGAAFAAHLRSHGNPTRWCSVGNMFALLEAARPAGVELIEYRQQIDPKRLGLVSCAAIALTGRDG